MELKANELRIGNLVSTISEEPEILSITQIDGIEETVIVESFSKPHAMDNFCPVLLTEEWSIKFGLEEQDLIELRGLVNFHGDSSEQLQYVHQLQNLHFALTGEELTRKDD